VYGAKDILRTVLWRHPLLLVSWTRIITLCIDEVQIQNITLVYINWTIYVHVATKPRCHQLLETWLTEIPILQVFHYVTLIQPDASYDIVKTCLRLQSYSQHHNLKTPYIIWVVVIWHVMLRSVEAVAYWVQKYELIYSYFTLMKKHILTIFINIFQLWNSRYSPRLQN